MEIIPNTLSPSFFRTVTPTVGDVGLLDVRGGGGLGRIAVQLKSVVKAPPKSFPRSVLKSFPMVFWSGM